MKQRVLTAAIGLVLLLAVLFFYHTWVFHIAIALVSALAVYELLQAAGIWKKSRLVSAVCLLFTLSVPFFRTPGFNTVSLIGVVSFLLALFGAMLYQHEKLRFETVCVAFAAAVLVPFSFSSLIYIRDHSARDGLFFLLLVFAGSWFADAGGYFIGRVFGKHKLAPVVSPNKTVEGAVGGVLFNIASFLLLGLGYYFYQKNLGVSVEVHYLQLGLIGALAAPVGMLGDLAASLVKRQCGIKDYGTIFPGHGGVMDRFDSVLFVAPFLYVVLQLLPLVS